MMIEFSVFDGSGKVVRTGTCPPELLKLQATNAGEKVVEGIVTQEPDTRRVNYTYRRMMEYPETNEQLDAIFKLAKALKEQGFTMPAETVSWLASVQLVKDKYPKGGV